MSGLEDWKLGLKTLKFFHFHFFPIQNWYFMKISLSNVTKVLQSASLYSLQVLFLKVNFP